MRAFCSTRRMVAPSRWMSRTMSKICRTSRGARPIDGSSSRRILGRSSRPRAMASICCSPPERAPAGTSSRRCNEGKRLICASTAARASSRPPGQGRASEPMRRFSATDMRCRMARPSGTSTIPAATATCEGAPASSRPSRRTDPPAGRTRPAMAFSVLLFPAPLGPMSATISPLPTVSETPRTASTCPYATRRSSTSSTGALTSHLRGTRRSRPGPARSGRARRER